MVVNKFLTQAEKSKDEVALKTRAGEWTYEQLKDAVLEMSEVIQKNGLEDNEPIGIAFANSFEFVVMLLAASYSGRASLLLGARLKAREISHHISITSLKVVYAAKSMEAVMSEAGAKKINSHNADINCWRFEQQKNTQDFVEGDFICQLTSGTNGLPKIAVRTEDAVWNEIYETANMLDITEKDSFLTIPPIHHSYGLIAGTLLPLCYGAKLTLLDGFMPSEVIDIVTKQKPSLLFAVPFMYHLINSALSSKKADFLSLRYCISAGAPMKQEVADEFYKRFDCSISQDYGSTEIGVICLNTDTINNPNSVGVTVSGDIKIVDEHGNELPRDVKGEIILKSKSTARAYIYPKELNQTAYNKEWFRIGDIGYVDKDGYVHVCGRKSSIINVAGLKVDPSEVENIIAQIEGVIEVAVIGIESNSSGQVVKAVISASQPLEEAKIIHHCKKNLSDYKIPRIIKFVKELPRGQTGKVLRKYL